MHIADKYIRELKIENGRIANVHLAQILVYMPTGGLLNTEPRPALMLAVYIEFSVRQRGILAAFERQFKCTHTHARRIRIRIRRTFMNWMAAVVNVTQHNRQCLQIQWQATITLNRATLFHSGKPLSSIFDSVHSFVRWFVGLIHFQIYSLCSVYGEFCENHTMRLSQLQPKPKTMTKLLVFLRFFVFTFGYGSIT